MMKRIFFLFFFSSLLATTTEPFSSNFSIGYRKEDLEFKALKNSKLQYEEDYHRISYLDTALALAILQRDFYVEGEGKFAFLASGKMTQTFNDERLFEIEKKVRDSIKGHDIAASILFGYLIHLTPHRDRMYNLMPLVGYDGIWKELKKTDKTFQSGLNSLESQLTNQWYGPQIGGEFQLYFTSSFNMKMRYLFHFYDQDFSSKQNYIVNDLFYETQKLEKDSIPGFSHSGKISFNKRIRSNVELGISSMIRYLASENHKIHKKIYRNDLNVIDGEEELILRSWSFNILVNARFIF